MIWGTPGGGVVKHRNTLVPSDFWVALATPGGRQEPLTAAPKHLQEPPRGDQEPLKKATRSRPEAGRKIDQTTDQLPYTHGEQSIKTSHQSKQ